MTYTHSITAYANSALIWDREKKDIEYSRCIGLYIVLNEVNAFIQQYFDLYEIPYGMVKAGIMGLLLLIFARSIIHFNRKEFIAFFIVLGIVSFLYMYSAIAGVNILYMADWALTSFGVGVPLATFAYLIEDKGKLYSCLYKCTWPILFMLIADFALFHEVGREYSLHFGYMMLFVMIFHLSYTLNDKKLRFIPLILAELALILVYGSRGAVACIGVYIILRFLAIPGRKELKTIVFMTMLILIPIGLLAIKIILPGLVESMKDSGFRVRTLEMISQGRLADFFNRTGVWGMVTDLMKQEPVFGWGIKEVVKYISPHKYPHQFFLDCWVTFGYIIGTLLIIPVMYCIAKVFRPDQSVEAELCRIYIAIEFVRLMISGTFFTSYQFYILVGLLITYGFRSSGNRILEVSEQ